MIRRTLSGLTLAATLLASGVGPAGLPDALAGHKWMKGDVCEAQVKGSWKKGTIVKIAGGRPLVHFDDGSADEWLLPSVLREAESAPAAEPATTEVPADPAPSDTPGPPAEEPKSDAAPAEDPKSDVAGTDAAKTDAPADPSASKASGDVPLADTMKLLGKTGKLLNAARLESTKFTAVSLDGASMSGTFSFENTTSGPLQVDKLDWVFKVGPNKLLGGNVGSKASIAAGGRQSITVPVTLDFNAVPGLVASLARGKAKFSVEAGAELTGPNNTKYAVPMKWDGELSLPKIPSFSLNSLELTDLGLTEIVVTLVVDFKNDNAFPIPLQTITGALSVNRGTVASLTLPEPKVLGPSAVTSVSLPLSISIADVPSDVIKQIKSGKATFEFAGDLMIGGKGMPFKFRNSARRK